LFYIFERSIYNIIEIITGGKMLPPFDPPADDMAQRSGAPTRK
jgi:hypothetical protein